MIGDRHQASGRQIIPNATGRVGVQHDPHAEVLGNPSRLNNALPRMTFVEVQPPLEDQDGDAPHECERKLSAMSMNAGCGQARDVTETDMLHPAPTVDHRPHPGAKHESDPRHMFSTGGDKIVEG